MEKGYLVIEQYNGSEDCTVMKTEEKAVSYAKELWSYLTPREKKTRRVFACYVEYVDEIVNRIREEYYLESTADVLPFYTYAKICNVFWDSDIELGFLNF